MLDLKPHLFGLPLAQDALPFFQRQAEILDLGVVNVAPGPPRKAPGAGSDDAADPFLEAVVAAAETPKDHDRWLLSRKLLERKLDGRRSTSPLPAR